MEEVRQVIEPESQETHIDINYYDKDIFVYSSKATVINRMLRMGYSPMNIEKMDGEVCSMTFKFSFNKFPRFISKSLFKCD